MRRNRMLIFRHTFSLQRDSEMALLKPNPNQEKVKFKAKIGTNILSEIAANCEWAGFSDHGEFIEQVVSFMLDKDPEWKQFKKGLAYE